MRRQIIRNDHDQAKWDISVFLDIPYQCQYEWYVIIAVIYMVLLPEMHSAYEG